MAINSLWIVHCNSLEYADYGNRLLQLPQNFVEVIATAWNTPITAIAFGCDSTIVESGDCNSLEYADYGNSSVARVRFVLMKLDSDYKHTTDYFGHKFMSKVEAIFSGLPKPKEWRSFFINDLPLLTSIDEDVQQIAV